MEFPLVTRPRIYVTLTTLPKSYWTCNSPYYIYLSNGLSCHKYKQNIQKEVNIRPRCRYMHP